jgi:hypothetical protein
MKACVHEFEVHGNGKVPEDMLRYDCCYPARTSGLMAGLDGYAVMHTIGPRDWKPTDGRWASFGWTVKNHIHKTCLWA